MVLKCKTCDPFVLPSSTDLFCPNSTFSSGYIGWLGGGGSLWDKQKMTLDSQVLTLCLGRTGSSEWDEGQQSHEGEASGKHVVYSSHVYILTLLPSCSFFTADENIPAKILSYNRANRAVAILCNHQRAPPKTFEKSMMNLQSKVLQVWMEG